MRIFVVVKTHLLLNYIKLTNSQRNSIVRNQEMNENLWWLNIDRVYDAKEIAHNPAINAFQFMDFLDET